jgi:hypothetical protein
MKNSISYLFCLIIIGCTVPESDKLPFGEGSRYPHLTKIHSGGLLVSWLEPIDSTTFGLYWSEFDQGVWSKPGLIYSSKYFFINWADFPSIFELNDSTLVTHWPEMSSTGTYDYDIKLVFSMDRGLSWSDPIIPHRDGKNAEHGFVSFYKDNKENLGLVWLDGRQMAGGHGGQGNPGHMNLYTTLFDQNFSQRDDYSIDAMVCECCPTSAVYTNGITLIAYRDRNESELRNINILRKVNNIWQEPYPVHDDGWIISGCPVNGPKLAEKDNKVAAAWYTEPNGEPRVNVAFSDNLGKSFLPPIRIDSGSPEGRVDITWYNNSTLVVCWLEAQDEYSTLVFRTVSEDGILSPIQDVVTLAGGRGIGYPQMESLGNELWFLWTDFDKKNAVMLKKAHL